MPLTSILKNRRIFCVCFDISRTAAQIPTKLWEVNPKTLSFDLITKETISVEWLLTSNRIKLFFNVFFWYILFLSMDFFRSTCNQSRFFSLIFVLIFIRVLAAISKQSWKTRYGIKFPKKWNTMWQDNPTICRLYRYRFFFSSEAHTRMTSDHMPRKHNRNLMGYNVTVYPVNLHFDVAKAWRKIPVRHSVFQQIGKGTRRSSTGY
jgi:hypothetical protein